MSIIDVSINGFTQSLNNPFTIVNGKSYYTGISNGTIGNYYYTNGNGLYIFQRKGDNTDACGNITVNNNCVITAYLVGGGGAGQIGKAGRAVRGGGGKFRSSTFSSYIGNSYTITVGSGGMSSVDSSVYNGKSTSLSNGITAAGGGQFALPYTLENTGKVFTDSFSNIYCYGAAGGFGSEISGGGSGGEGYNSYGYILGTVSDVSGGGGGGYDFTSTNYTGGGTIPLKGGNGGGGGAAPSDPGGAGGIGGIGSGGGGGGAGGSIGVGGVGGVGGAGGVGGGGGGGGGGHGNVGGVGGAGGINGGGGGGGGDSLGNNDAAGGSGGVGLLVLVIGPPIVCFKEGSLILTNNGYVPVEELRKGDLIKTLKHDYVPIHMIGKRKIYHYASQERIKDQLYKCSQDKYPDLFEDLVITGCHSILVDNFSDWDEVARAKEVYEGQIYTTDEKFRLPACADLRTTIYETPGEYTVYHLALENDDYYMNYGIYANGLLVETCSKRYLKECSDMTIIE